MIEFTYEGITVLGFDMPLTEGTQVGTCTAQEMSWDREAQYYTAPGGVLTPMTPQEMEVVEFDNQKIYAKDDVKTSCQNHIYNNYSAPIQQSMALGIYPSEQCDTMVQFIADCIAMENTNNDLLEAATTATCISDIVDAIVWPEV